MQLATYESIARRVLVLLGEGPSLEPTGEEGPDEQRWIEVREAISQALERWWHTAWWPSLMRVEARPLRDAYDAATAYTAGDEIWHEPSGKYYLALKATTGNAPATYAAGEWTTAVAYWAECKRSYGADDYASTTAYVAGDQVYYPTTATWYQCHTASANHAPTDTSYWGELVDFVPKLPRTMGGYLAIGHIRAMYDRDPRRFGDAACRLDYTETDDGWQVHDWVSLPWVEYRLRAPRLLGEAFDDTATYTVDDDLDLGVPMVPTEVETMEFATVALMLASDTTQWTQASCQNYEGTDGNWSVWVKTGQVLADNGDDIRVATDGAVLRRQTIRIAS